MLRCRYCLMLRYAHYLRLLFFFSRHYFTSRHAHVGREERDNKEMVVVGIEATTSARSRYASLSFYAVMRYCDGLLRYAFDAFADALRRCYAAAIATAYSIRMHNRRRRHTRFARCHDALRSLPCCCHFRRFFAIFLPPPPPPPPSPPRHAHAAAFRLPLSPFEPPDYHAARLPLRLLIITTIDSRHGRIDTHYATFTMPPLMPLRLRCFTLF